MRKPHSPRWWMDLVYFLCGSYKLQVSLSVSDTNYTENCVEFVGGGGVVGRSVVSSLFGSPRHCCRVSYFVNTDNLGWQQQHHGKTCAGRVVGTVFWGACHGRNSWHVMVCHVTSCHVMSCQIDVSDVRQSRVFLGFVLQCDVLCISPVLIVPIWCTAMQVRYGMFYSQLKKKGTS